MGVLGNPAAKRYNLIGRYIAKIDDIKLTLYSASGHISTNFSVNIADIWRVKVAMECASNTVDSNFVVIDITWYGSIKHIINFMVYVHALSIHWLCIIKTYIVKYSQCRHATDKCILQGPQKILFSCIRSSIVL